MHELKCFVTLTYSDKFLPPGKTLVKRHFQLFMKRLRKLHKYNVRYFMCGEYGDKDRRPHYHALLFGIDFADKKVHSTSKRGHKLYISETLDKTWGLGHCWIGNVTHQSAGYCARYALKKITGDRAITHYQNVDIDTGEIHNIIPEYGQMSLRPAIGKTWYEKYKSDVFPSDFLVIAGKKAPVPEYYAKLLKRENPEAHEAVKSARFTEARKDRANQTPARLAVREECLTSKITQLKRTL